MFTFAENILFVFFLQLTAAELVFIHFMIFPSLGGVEIDWSKFPKLRDLKKRVEEDEQIAAWIKNRPVTQM
jgi:hypothetical protein